MIVIPDTRTHVRQLIQHDLNDGRGIRTYYTLNTHIPILLRTDGNLTYHDLVLAKQPCRALFSPTPSDWAKAIASGIPLPQAWEGLYIHRVSLVPCIPHHQTIPLCRAIWQKLHVKTKDYEE
jgi:hypothetical protein